MAFHSLPETNEKVTEVKGIFCPWKNMSIHWQRQFIELIHEIPKVDGRDLGCVEADCLTGFTQAPGVESRAGRGVQ